MSIKVTIGESETQKEKPFPKLMLSKNSDYIVLLDENHSGVVVWSEYPEFYVGMHRKEWYAIESFTYFEGSITLQND